MNQYFVIGDIHGCLEQLNEILEIWENYPSHKLIFLGDYIDRGPNSNLVCKRIFDLNAIFLKGNHEIMLLNRLHDFPEQKSKTLEHAKLEESIIRLFETKLLNIFEDEDHIFVHAGLDPNKPLESQSEYDYLWTIFDGDYQNLTNKKVIHGHSIVTDAEIVGNRININTGCGSGGYLTGLVLPEMKFFRSSKSFGHEYNLSAIRRELEEGFEELRVQDA